MIRIYQGRVTQVEALKSGTKNEWEPLPDWQDALWKHHELFQDAVNYYIVALLALATESDNPLFKISRALAAEGSDFQIWRPFSRRGRKRRGLGEWVAPYLTPGNPSPTPDQCFEAVLAGSEVSAAVRDLALAELLHVCSGDAPIKNQGAWMLARFCVSDYTGSFPFDAAAFARDAGEARLATELHSLTTDTELRSFATQMDISWVVNLAKGSEAFSGEKSRSRLLKSVAHFLQAFGGKSPGTKMGERVFAYLQATPSAQEDLSRLRDAIVALNDDLLPSIPANNRVFPTGWRLACFSSSSRRHSRPICSRYRTHR